MSVCELLALQLCRDAQLDEQNALLRGLTHAVVIVGAGLFGSIRPVDIFVTIMIFMAL